MSVSIAANHARIGLGRERDVGSDLPTEVPVARLESAAGELTNVAE
jgi:hypothetical protein